MGTFSARRSRMNIPTTITLPAKVDSKVDIAAATPTHILFFDGECVMCNGVVKWLYKIDRGNALTFASLHGATAARLRAEHAAFPDDMDSFVFWDDGEVRVRSRAAFYASRHMKFPWNLGYLLRFIPLFLTDPVYRFIARNRLDWFGTTETCWLPPAEAAHRFLE